MRTSWIGPRGRNILHVGSWSLAAKAAAAANLFLPIPFVLADLGPAQFGVWVTLVSLTTLAGFLDFGFSNGAMNLIAAAHARGSASEVATIVREAILALSRIAVWLVLPVLAALAIVPWHHLFGLPETLSGECPGVCTTRTRVFPSSISSPSLIGSNGIDTTADSWRRYATPVWRESAMPPDR